jgi:hypothetical protein
MNDGNLGRIVRYTFGIGLVVLGAVACSSQPPIRPLLVPEMTDKLTAAKKHAVKCKDPVVAVPKFNEGFKYGCFCGKGWPAIALYSDVPVGDMSPNQRAELIEEYYRIKPVDDVDAVCQAHDVCWVMNGPLIECNDKLQAETWAIGEAFDKARPRRPPDSLQVRCRDLAWDISVAALYFMEGDSPTLKRPYGVGKVVVAPMMGGLAVVLLASRDANSYPTEVGLCNKPDQRRRSSR